MALKNLIDIKSLQTEQILEIIKTAKDFEAGTRKSSSVGKNAAVMFFENSTRTRFSFEMACHNLGMRIFNFETQKSSLTKGEEILDTLNNLASIGLNAAIIRHLKEGLLNEILSENPQLAIINAGEGKNSHPTQALLDFYTITKHLGSIENKNVVIVGDIAHSRVAKSNIELIQRFNANITCCAPKYFQDKTIKNVTWSEDLSQALKNADIVMCLRIQNERLENKIPLLDYVENFQVNEKNFNNKALLMHPGPVNRNIELSSSLMDSKCGKIILEQPKNGVFVRTAVLDLILGRVC